MSNYALQIRTIEEKIFLIRSHKVMLDHDLATLYGVETKTLKRAVKRNLDRFPSDFMFVLSREEFHFLRSQNGTLEPRNLRYQFGTSSSGYGGRRYLPFAFTENGVAMLSSVLNSKRAIHVNIQIMRAFTKIREWLSTHRDLQEKIKKLERKFDKKFAVVFKAIQLLLDGPQKPVQVKGFSR